MAGLGRANVLASILFFTYEICLGIRVEDMDALASDEQNQQEAEGEYEGLLTPWEADALVEATSQQQSMDQEQQKFLPAQRWAFGMFRKLLKQGKQKEAAITCMEIQQSLTEVVNAATELIGQLCTQGTCDLAALNIDLAVTTQSKFIALASAADKKRCLPEVLKTVSFQKFVEIIPTLLGDSDVEKQESQSQSRMKAAYSQMLSFQKGFVSLADGVADRKLLLSQEFLGESCPCDKCQPLSGHSFRCYLTEKHKDKAMPRGVMCSEAPKKRYGSLFMTRKYSTKCTVTDWEQAALQQLHISAVMSCASLTMVLGLRSEVAPGASKELFGTCLDVKQTAEASDEKMKFYKEKLKALDDVVSKQDKMVMGLVLTFGQVSGIADLRVASRGNLAPSALLQGDSKETFSQVFAKAAEEAGLAGQDADADMYGDQNLLHRDQVRQRLKASKTATVQAAGPVAQGTTPLLLFVLEARGNSKDTPDGLAVASQNAPRRGGAALVIVGTIFLVFFVAAIGLQVWLSHLIAMVFLGALAGGVVGGLKTVLYVVFFLVGWGLVSAAFHLLCLITSGSRCGAKVKVEKS